MIEAKPVIPDQYWILREHDRKIGNIEATDRGYQVNLNGRSVVIKNLDSLTATTPIDFKDILRSESRPETVNSVHGYATSSPAYNAIFDVQHQLPLWTHEPRSRSWLAAGWYRVRQHRNWRIVHCPKLILLERYQYQGPFHSAEEARRS
jgi:hypothetical protein